MAINLYKNPKVTKLDGRYKHYPKFKYRIDFDTKGMEKWEQWHKTIIWCRETWGEEYEFIAAGLNSYRKFNEHWRTEMPKNKWYRQLYLTSEQAVTLFLLVAGA